MTQRDERAKRVTPCVDDRFMAAALSIGWQGAGRTAPNPSVGAVVVADGRVVGLGRTADGGRPHAEVIALRQAAERARSATLYVTLEPCSHTGRSPPCVDAVIAAAVKRVVVATRDQNPLVAGRGIARLGEAGIDVTVGVREAQAQRDLAGHISRMTRGLPHVVLKLAVSADGAIGRRGEGQLAISGPLSRRRAQVLRAEHDAIAIGIGTVLADDPALTCRLPGMAALSPRIVVFDTDARTPPAAAALAGGALVLAAPDADPTRVAALTDAGATVLAVPRGGDGRIDPAAALRRLAGEGLATVLVEGGAGLAAALADGDLIDEAIWIASPVRLGGDAVRTFGGAGPDRLALRLPVRHVETVGEDRWIHLWRQQCSLAS